jgi:excinuclease ABC subunit A
MIQGKSIAELTGMTPGRLRDFLLSLKFTGKKQRISEPILLELLPKLELLEKAGLSYLTLDRSADTLSGGEAQRIRLAAQVASNLRGVAYVLDEPTIGIHPHDNKNLLKIIRDLQKKGNSVIIVEHDQETIRNADFIIDLGKGGGTHGGRIVAAGTVHDLMQNSSSITGAYLSGRNNHKTPVACRPIKGCPQAGVVGARENNLKKITARFPAGRLTVVTGVSGSGKTTLVRETLYKGFKKLLGSYHGRAGTHKEIIGAEHFKRIVEIDQSPIGKTPRSIPATYVGFYDEIRCLFSLLPDAKIRGYSSARFSFNLNGGRCSKCMGQGKIKVAMSFLPDMYVDCDVCQGSRFNDETMQILYKDKNISQVLSMTVEEACSFFKGIPAIHKPLSILHKMGLGYIPLGQPSPTLSGGEAQRIKIAAELSKKDHGKTLYILDEPTTGLHCADIEKLMNVLQDLVDLGNTLVIIEHNLDVISQADHIIDLGPEGGDRGGSIVADGSPKDLASCRPENSYTAKYLGEYLQRYGICYS